MRQGVGRVIRDAFLHAIPGYGLYHGLSESQDESIPFAIKARNAALGGASHGFYLSTLTHYAIKMQDYQILTKGYYSGPTHGWAMYRFLITRVLPPTAVAAAVVGVGAGVSYAIAGEEGLQDYGQFLTEPKHMPFRTSWSIARLMQHYL